MKKLKMNLFFYFDWRDTQWVGHLDSSICVSNTISDAFELNCIENSSIQVALCVICITNDLEHISSLVFLHHFLFGVFWPLILAHRAHVQPM